METVDGNSNMSKADILRGIVAEKLTAAAQEVFAVLERTVAGYEEEASALRQEIDRQRRQLESLLQPVVKLETMGEQFPVCEPAAGGGAELPDEEEQHKYEPSEQFPVCEPAAGGGAEPDEEEQHKYEPSVDNSGSLGLTCYAELQMEEHEEEADREHLTEPDSEIASRSLTPSVQFDQGSAGRPPVIEPQDHIDLRIRVLEDSQIEVLSVYIFKKYPVQEVRCPLDLQEEDFLDLLRSTFPQLAARKLFDIFISDRSRRLQPLRVKTLTPEEIYRSISSSGHSALYIRLKTQEELQSTDEEFHPSKKKDAAAESTFTADQTRVQSVRRKPGRPRISEIRNYIDLRICILEDSQTDVLSANVYKKYPVQEMRSPCGLQEEDFLNLLRSTFPQLAAQKPFDFFTTDRSKRLQPLRVKTLTPEEINKTAGHSALYIRQKLPEEVKAREEEPPQRKGGESPSTDRTRRNLRVLPDRRKACIRRITEPQNHVNLRICILEDSQINVLSKNVYKKYAVQELQYPCGLQEEDFLDLLTSTFPQLAARKPFDVFTSDKRKRLQPLRVKTLTPEEIHRSIRQTGAGTSALYIRLKAQEEEEELHQGSSSTSDQTSPVLASSSRSQHEDVETEQADGGAGSESAVGRLWSLLVLSESEGDRGEVSDDDWKPDRREKHLRDSEPDKKRRKRRVKSSGIRTKSPKASADARDAPLSCKVCGAARWSASMLIKHAWSHVDDPGRLCGVCGGHSESAEELRNHLQSHLKTHSCNICAKSFLSVNGLNGHVARHAGKKPYKCKICHKAFAQKWVLNNHERGHAANKPYKCDFCPKSCASKVELTRHRLTHTGRRLHPCNTCGKSLDSSETLSKHMLRHREPAAARTTFACEICRKTFSTYQTLQVHMRVHTGEKPYKCSECNTAFRYRHCVKRHMKTQHSGSGYCRTEASV
ncbi:uncharacterized protein LOC121626322 isoform X2 [Chelmon rostratus]|uniref:uncharacterized protein LOC121626322 isoform X2 n=1 Tax=Chelmon rostratus TaxID=109905 RepID=UPI001BEC5606|nr:uncharacterized protein LOC121626322 isoform X2 [Chelmon rostratus]